MNPISIVRAVLLTAAVIRHRWVTLVTALLLPALCISFVEAIGSGLPNGLFYSLLSWAIGAPFYALFAVVCHRTVILGGSSLPSRFGIFWTERETRFVGWTIAIIILHWLITVGVTLLALLLATILPIPGLPLVILVFVWAGLAYFYARLAMLFPATAVGDSTSFKRTWNLTDGNGFRLIGVLLFTVGPVVLVAIAIGFVVGFLLGVSGTISAIILDIFYHVVRLVAVCAISVSYRELIDIESQQFPDRSSAG